MVFWGSWERAAMNCQIREEQTANLEGAAQSSHGEAGDFLDRQAY